MILIKKIYKTILFAFILCFVSCHVKYTPIFGTITDERDGEEDEKDRDGDKEEKDNTKGG